MLKKIHDLSQDQSYVFLKTEKQEKRLGFISPYQEQINREAYEFRDGEMLFGVEFTEFNYSVGMLFLETQEQAEKIQGIFDRWKSKNLENRKHPLAILDKIYCIHESKLKTIQSMQILSTRVPESLALMAREELQ